MSQPLNIQGVTKPLVRHYGGDVADSAKRFLTSKGYTEVVKKIFNTNDINKIKKHLTEAGLSVDKLHTHKPIKERTLIRDIKTLAKTGVLNRPVEQAIDKFRQTQIKEQQFLMQKEKKAFQNLTKSSKQELMWEDVGIESLSPGAQKAMEQTKEREITTYGTKFGIKGYDKLADEGNLSKKIRLLKEHPHKNVEAWTELQRLENLASNIREQDKRNPKYKLSEKYGLVEIQKATSEEPVVSGSNKTTVISGAANTINTADKASASQSVSISANAGSVESVDVEPENKERIETPITKIDRKLSAVQGGLPEKVKPQPAKQTDSGGKKYGFIKPTGDVKLAA